MKNLSKTIFALICLNLFCIASNAQVFSSNQADTKIKGASLVKINTKRNCVDFVKLSPAANVNERDHLTWLSKEVLHLPSDITLQKIKTETDLNGYVHYRYREFYNGIPVEYGVYYVHIKNGYVEAANGEFYTEMQNNTTPSITRDIAFSKALEEIPSSKYNDNNSGGLQAMKSGGELMMLPGENNQCRLAYKFDIYSLEPLKRVFIYIDAITGKKLKEENRINIIDAQATAVTAYNGTVTMTTDSISPTNFRLQASKGFGGLHTLNLNNGTNYGSATDFTDADNYWNTASIDRYAYDAHYGSEATYDFYFTKFGRNSYDNSGAQINAYVHYSTGFVNAFWDGTQMTYGDGDGIAYNPLTSLDIVGHEITHAVTENSAGLIYSNESGALNESFSDCFGITIDYFKNPLTANFLEGDQINVNGIPFRNMGDPNQYSNPDCYGGLYWNNPNEVHNNSGVQNFWYYLICMGGSGVNDLGNSYLVNAIGMNDASAIAYRNLTVYLTPNSDYADARFYSIQSAIDLFGSCSEQVIQVTNAWYAVGVGGLFSNAVVAGFAAPQNYFCVVPATVNFANQSLNATSYSWDFGDGTTSTLASPSHTYSLAGTYNVTLIANGAALCANADTILKPNHITVTNGGGPVSASCSPATVSYCCGVGITNVSFGTINKTSPDANEGYKDFTCGTATTLTAGNPVPISITTGVATYENVKVWIDYDNNGMFNNATELAFTSTNELVSHTGIVNNSINAVLNTPLRMRVIDDNTSVSIPGACSNPQNGQAEDYTITYIANTLPPIANFTANVTTINLGSSVNFSDLTQNAATSWLWNFAGGTPSSSTVQNPTVVYNTLGSYTVSLTVSNSFGTDSITKIAYINVVNSISLCTGVTTTSAPNGQLYDSGGPTGDYNNNENCTLLIDPGCALSITLSFSSFASEGGFDYFRVYDGTSAAAPLILTANGSSLPPNVTANSGKMFISWSSDNSVVLSGWAATWTSFIGSGLPPVAAFGLSTANPPLSTPVQFTDQTTNTPNSWTWDFGDGQTAITQNPTHSYTSPGTYTATLIAANCTSSDTITQNIIAQGAPVISVNPDSISVSLNCHDSITVPLVIYNTGSGDLVFNIAGTGNGISGDTSVLVIQDGAAWSFYMAPFLQTNYGLTATVITSSQIATTDFSLYNVIITVSAQSASYYSDLSANVAKFESFVAAGGVLQYQMATQGATNTSLVGGATMTYGTESQNNGLLLSHPILNGVANPILGNSASHCSMTNVPAGAQVITEAAISGQPTTVEYNYGDGVVIASGMTWEFYYGTANTIGLMLPNSTSYIFSKIGSIANWITLSATTATIAPGDSLIVYVTINSSGLNAGTYDGNLTINSNDPSSPQLNVPVHLITSGPAIIAMSDTCLSFGTIMQYTTAQNSVAFSNSGCDTLHITSMTSNDPAYTVNPGLLNVAPGETGSVVVTFNPQTIGNFNALLSIFNNDIDTVICLNGASGAAPVITVNPDSIAVTLSCNDSIVIPVTISNTGGSDLVFTVNGSGLLSDTVQVLAYMTGVDTTEEYPGTLLAIDQYFTKYKVTKFYATDPGALQTALQNKDVLLFPEHETSALGNYTAISTVVQNFVSTGKTVVVCGSASAIGATRIFDMGLFTGTFVSYITGGTLDVLDTTDVLTDQVPLSFLSPNATFYDNITNADKVKLVEYGTYDVVTYRTIGAGKAIYLGFDYYNTEPGSSKIIANAIQSVGNNLPGWLHVLQITDTLAPGDSTVIYVTINSAGFNAGVYNGQITINSNDPLNPIDTIPVNLVISGPAILAMSDTCLSFGTIMQYTFAYDTVSFSNSGCDTLHITSMTSNDPAFTVNPGLLNVAPGDTGSVVVTFNPQTIGNFNALLSIINNDMDTVICLNGASGAAPVITVNPDSISVTLGCTDSIVIPVTITNTGGSDLTFSVSGNSIALAGDTSVLVIQETDAWNLLMFDFLQTQYGITPTVINSSQIAATDFSLYNVIITVGDESNAYYTNISNNVAQFEAFAAAGGIVQYQMATQGGTSINLIGGATMIYGNLQNQNTGLILSHPILNGISNPLEGNSANHCFLTNVPAGAQVITETSTLSLPTTIEYNYGSGDVIATGMTWEYLYTHGYNTSLMLPNAIAYIFSKIASQPSWLTIANTTETLVPGDSITVYVTVYSGGLSGGTYNANILLASNDPLHPFDTVPVTLNVSFNPCADFVYNIPSSCSGTVNFTDTTFNAPTSWHWDFGDGDTSVLQNPAHQYQNTGSYIVTLIVTNAFGADTITHTVNVNVLPANFTVSGILATATPLQFTPNAPGATSWSWNFGDGNLSGLQSPVHSYTAVGTYIVTLAVSNGTCFNSSTDTLVITLNGIDDKEDVGSLMIVPNPFQDNVTISYSLTTAQDVSLQVIDVTGKLTEEIVSNELQVPGRYNYTFEGYAPGVYFVKMKIGSSVSVHKIVKMH